jgi:hypothetical protein
MSISVACTNESDEAIEDMIHDFTSPYKFAD